MYYFANSTQVERVNELNSLIKKHIPFILNELKKLRDKKKKILLSNNKDVSVKIAKLNVTNPRMKIRLMATKLDLEAVIQVKFIQKGKDEYSSKVSSMERIIPLASIHDSRIRNVKEFQTELFVNLNYESTILDFKKIIKLKDELEKLEKKYLLFKF